MSATNQNQLLALDIIEELKETDARWKGLIFKWAKIYDEQKLREALSLVKEMDREWKIKGDKRKYFMGIIKRWKNEGKL